MKRFYGLLLIFVFALLALTPLNLLGGEPFSQNAFKATTEADNVISVTQDGSTSNISLEDLSSNVKLYASAYLELNEDITISSNWTPIGSAENPFIGTFDGNGHTITFETGSNVSGMYQGLFGYAGGATIEKGATIKNLQVRGEYSNSFNGTQSEIFAGLLLGYGRNTTIENCEVVSDSAEQTVEQVVTKKITYGTLAGRLVGGAVKNVNVIAGQNFKANLSNSYTIKFGGAIGSTDNVKIEKTVVFGDVKLTTPKGKDVNSQFYVGGMIGEAENGSLSDCVVGVNLSVVKAEMYAYKVGEVIGNILSMNNSGSINSIAFSGAYDAFGYAGSYNYANLETKDYVINVADPTILKTESFFVNDYSVVESQGQSVTFGWNQSAEPWDFTSRWLVINTQSGQEVRLQSFQSFDFSLESVIDDNGMLQAQGNSKREDVSYGEYATFTLGFKDDIYSTYYDISEILKDGVPLGLESFEEKDGEMVSTDGAISLSETTTGEKRTFELKILSSSTTEGRYSFRLSAVRFPIYLVAGNVRDGQINLGENGSIRYSNSSSLTTNIEREVSNGTVLTVDAVANRLYSFDSWKLYYLEEDDLGELTYAGQKWALAENVADLTKTSTITINFGVEDENETIFNQTFLLLATFVYDPYTLNFNYDSNLISKVEINNQTLQTNSIQLDKNENVNIKVYVSSKNTLNSEKITQSIKNLFASQTSRFDYESYTDPTNSEMTIYEFSFSTSALKENDNKSYSISLVATEGDGEPEKDNTMWIIIGVVGGVVVLGLIGLTIWLVLRKRAIKSINHRNDDYKKYFY